METKYRIRPRIQVTPEWAYEGSPWFSYAFGSIASTGEETLDLFGIYAECEKYAPFNELVVHNDSTAFVYIVFNRKWMSDIYADELLVAPTTSIVLEREGLRLVTIANPDAGEAALITENKVRVSWRRKPWDVDEIARRRYFGR